MTGNFAQYKANKLKYIAAFFLRGNYCIWVVILTKITMIAMRQCINHAKISKITCKTLMLIGLG